MKDRFTISIDHPVIRDHVVDGHNMMPGLAYVDLVHQFLRDAGYAIEEWELRDLSIYEALTVDRDNDVELTVESTESDDGDLKIVIESSAGKSTRPRRHVTVRAVRTGGAAFDEQIDIAAVLGAAQSFEVEPIYEHLRDLGLAHGDFMRVSGRVYVAEDAAYTNLAVSPAGEKFAAETLFSPALLDGSAVCGSVGLAHADVISSSRLMLPIYFRSFRASGPLGTSVLSRLRFDLAHRKNDVSYLTLELFDERGAKVAELIDLGGTSGLQSAAERTHADAARSRQKPESAAATAGPPASDQTVIERRIAEMLSAWLEQEGLPVPPGGFDPQAGFGELSVDSSGLLQMLNEIEKQVGHTLPPTLLFEHASISELASYLLHDPGDLLNSPAQAEARHTVELVDMDPASYLCQLLASMTDTKAEQIDRDASFGELGLDSTQLLSLLKTLEEKIGADLAPTLLFEYRTANEISDYLLAQGWSTVAVASPDGLELPVTVTEGAEPSIEPSGDAGTDTVDADSLAAVDGSGHAPRDASSAADRNITPQPTAADDGDIAIIGICGRFPGAGSLDDLWQVLSEGQDCIKEIPKERWDYREFAHYEDYCSWGDMKFCHWGGFIDGVDKFDASFFGFPSLHADCMDPNERLFLESAYHVLEVAGYTRRRLKSEHANNVGVYVGAMFRDYGHVEGDISQELGTYLAFHSSIANRVSYYFDLNGPSIAFDTMCSSSAVAIHNACKDLRSGDCELAIVGGVNLSLHHKKFIGLSHEKLVGTSPSSRSFSKSNGYLPAEAVGAVLLKPLASARKEKDRVLAVVKASAVNHSGRANGYTVPNPVAQSRVIESCIARAGVEPESIGYVEASSNGSSLGDPLELVALTRAFGDRLPAGAHCPIGTVKSNIGHAEGASTMTQLAKVLLQFEHGQLPPSIFADELNPLARWDDTPFRLVRELQKWPRPITNIDGKEHVEPRRAVVNSFGAGGTNASLLLEEFVEPVETQATLPARKAKRSEIITLSARSVDRLASSLRRLASHMNRHSDLPVPDIAYTLQVGREHMRVRVAMVAKTRDELMDRIGDTLERLARGVWGPSNASDLIFLGGLEALPHVTADQRSVSKEEVLRWISEGDACALAEYWARDGAVPWSALHRGRDPRIVPLPGYPFKRERHWLAPRAEAHASNSGEAAATQSGDKGMLEKLNIGYGGVMQSDSPFVAPRNAMERAVARIWADVLEVESVGVTDDFFALGGDSLQAGLAFSRCAEEFDVQTDWSELIGSDLTVSNLVLAIVSAMASEAEEHESEPALVD